MAISEHASGSQTTSGTTEHSLGSDPDTTDGVFQLVLDLADMTAGDVLEIRAKEKARSGDTQRTIQTWVLSHNQTDPLFVSPSMIFLHGWVFTVKATAGGIVIPWSVRKVA